MVNPEQGKPYSLNNIEFVARNLAQGITPMLLLSEGMNEEANQLQRAIDTINDSRVMDLVEVRIKDIRKKARRQRPKTSRTREYASLPRQMYLESAHPQGYDGMWQIQTQDRKDEPFQFRDPERGINKMHYRKRLYKTHIIIQDLGYLKGQFRFWRMSEGEKRKKIEESMSKSIQYLKKVGVWQILEGNFSLEERILIHEIIANYKEPIKDPHSSEGFTIYPNEASWTREIYGNSDEE